MRGKIPEAKKVPSIIFIKVVGLVAGNNAYDGATSSSCPTEIAFGFAVEHHDGTVQA